MITFPHDEIVRQYSHALRHDQLAWLIQAFTSIGRPSEQGKDLALIGDCRKQPPRADEFQLKLREKQSIGETREMTGIASFSVEIVEYLWQF
jgi:hypothetical protein